MDDAIIRSMNVRLTMADKRTAADILVEFNWTNVDEWMFVRKSSCAFESSKYPMCKHRWAQSISIDNWQMCVDQHAVVHTDLTHKKDVSCRQHCAMLGRRTGQLNKCCIDLSSMIHSYERHLDCRCSFEWQCEHRVARHVPMTTNDVDETHDTTRTHTHTREHRFLLRLISKIGRQLCIGMFAFLYP
jgi:hypothetical protein